MTEEEKKIKPGPDEERLKLDGDWKDAMKKAIGNEKPEGGWPTSESDDPRKLILGLLASGPMRAEDLKQGYEGAMWVAGQIADIGFESALSQLRDGGLVDCEYENHILSSVKLSNTG